MDPKTVAGMADLAKAESRDDRESIFGLASHPGPRLVRIGAVHSLAQRYGIGAVTELIALLRSDDEDVRRTAAYRLYELHDVDAAGALLAHIDDETSDHVLAWCVAASPLADERAAVGKASEILATGGPNSRARASMVLLKSNLPEAIRALRNARPSDMPTKTRRLRRRWKLWRHRRS
jgi:HEAT repeat protein